MSDAPTFLARGDRHGHMVADFPGTVQAYVRSLAKGRDEFDLEWQITEAGQDRTRAQEKGFHAMLSHWAKHRGEPLNVVKQACLREAFGTFSFAHKGTGLVFEVLAEPSSSKLSRAKYCHLIETAMQMAAEDEPACILMAPDEYRRIRDARRASAAKASEGNSATRAPQSPSSDREDRA